MSEWWQALLHGARREVRRTFAGGMSQADGGMAMASLDAARHTGAMTDEIVPDGKDWTWVLDTACPECGFDAASFDAPEVGSMIRSNAAEFTGVLASPADDLRRRPDSATWSSLEYGAHVRDVYRLFRERLMMMLDSDNPLYPNWDQDETATVERYNEQDPAVVATELSVAAAALADAFDGVTGERWQRQGRRSDGAVFTVDTFARYLVHDPIHHLHDVRSGNELA